VAKGLSGALGYSEIPCHVPPAAASGKSLIVGIVANKLTADFPPPAAPATGISAQSAALTNPIAQKQLRQA